MDDPQEVIMEGSDEEFGDPEDLDEIENGTDANTKFHHSFMKVVIIMQRVIVSYIQRSQGLFFLLVLLSPEWILQYQLKWIL